MSYTTVDLPIHGQYGAYKWAAEKFGKPKGPDGSLTWNELVWYSRTLNNPPRERFYFLSDKDAMWFKLRWA